MIKSPKLLTREEAKIQCFARDKQKCVFCSEPPQDAHHIIERKLWSDQGMYLDNLASVCDKHHRLCEDCTITVEEVRAAAGITNILVPPGFDPEQIYDKWGNMRHKYPRTFHADWSLSLQNDDRRLPSLEPFIDKRVIVTEKMDGENTTMYSDFIHARSIDSCRQQHESRDMVKRIHGQIKHMIPEGWRICGENMYAKHSIYYDNLESYFLGFAVYDENNVSLPWDEAVYIMQELGVVPVKVLYDGVFDEQLLRQMAKEQDPTKVEGYVCRVADAIPYSTWFYTVFKYVRAKHVQTTQHWMTAEIIPNKLREK